MITFLNCFGRSGPRASRGQVSREEWERLRGLAAELHGTRLAAIYVASDLEAGAPPLADVGDEQAGWLYGLAEARLAMEGARDWRSVDLQPDSDAQGFMNATDDAEQRKLIFGQASFDKLAEIGNMRDWMVWLRKQFQQADMQAQESLRRELMRVVPGPDDPGDEKWQIRVRFHSPAQSVRNQAVGVWNSWPTWIKLSTVQNDPQALDVTFTLREAIPLQAIGQTGYNAARIFLVALNIGTLGLWWWHLAEQTNTFYERLTDLKATTGSELRLKMHAWPEFEWKREALKDHNLRRVGMCLGMIASLDKATFEAMIHPYFMGLGYLAKTDLHINLAPSACERFATCLLGAMRHFGDWSGSDDTLVAAISAFLSVLGNVQGDLDELVDVLRRMRDRSSDLRGTTLDRAGILKLLCDAYLNRQFEKMAASSVLDKVEAKPATS